MAMKPNYFLQRADRSRAKEAKKLEKQQKRDEETARRKAAREAEPAGGSDEGKQDS